MSRILPRMFVTVVIVALVSGAIGFFSFEWLYENDLTMLFFMLYSGAGIFAARFASRRFSPQHDRSVPARPLSPMESINVYVFIGVLFSVGAPWILDGDVVSHAIGLGAVGAFSASFGFALGLRKRQSALSAWEGPVLLRDEDLQKYTERILTSDRYLTALRSTLPKGEEDETNGLDHIPFLLAGIDRRRRDFARSSQLFLLAIIAFGLVFSVLLSWYGFVLIDAMPVGVERSVRDISVSLGKISGYMDQYALTAEMSERRSFIYLGPLEQKVRNMRLEEGTTGKLLGFLPGLYRPEFEGFDDIRRFPAVLRSQFVSFEYALRDLKDSDDLTEEQYQELSRALSKAREMIGVTDEQMRALLDKILIQAARIEHTSKEAAALLGEETPRLYSLVKRIAVGLLVGSFFIGILRYLAGLYDLHLQQVARADRDDMATRRFFVSYKTAGDDPEQKKAAVQEFLKTLPSMTEMDG
ncbi:MAG: hypothetical protein IH991_24420, partial [Planctomycetes bacterium]|nr:hypothetical protein [Planctomycetota bacterium]